VTKIPPEHTAAKALEDAFRALGEQRAPARRRYRPTAGPARVLVTALASVLVVAGAATGTKVFLGDGGMLDSDEPGLSGLDGRVEPAPDYRQLAKASASDPAQPQPWGLRTFRSAKGDTCLTLGRVVGGRLGTIRGGQFKELPTRAGGPCGDVEAHHVTMSSRTYAASTIPGGRTVLYGAVDRTVTGLAIVSAEGRRTPVRIASDGTFLVVRAGPAPFHLAHLVIDGSAGRRTQLIAR